MGSERLPDLVAPLVVVVVAAALLLPYLALTSGRRRRVDPRKAVGVTVALVYGMALVAYVLLPLPRNPAAFCARHHLSPHVVPFDGFGHASGFLQLGFNVLLFVPFGLLIRSMTDLATTVTTLCGLGVSLVVELTQLTGVWFLYPCDYRTFDVNDIVGNTVGAAVGAALAPSMLRLLGGYRYPKGNGS